MDRSERSALFIKKIMDGTIPKRFLINHGEDYTAGAEDIACVRFNRYIGSCSCLLMNNRIEKETKIYHGC